MILLLDYSKGFGGKYGVQKDRVDKVGILSEQTKNCKGQFFIHVQYGTKSNIICLLASQQKAGNIKLNWKNTNRKKVDLTIDWNTLQNKF